MPGDADDVKVQNQLGDMSLEVGVDYFLAVIADEDVFQGAYYLRADPSTFITQPCQDVIFRGNQLTSQEDIPCDDVGTLLENVVAHFLRSEVYEEVVESIS